MDKIQKPFEMESTLKGMNLLLQELILSFKSLTPTVYSELYPSPLYCLSEVFGRRRPGRVAQSVGQLTRKSGVLGSIPGLAAYFRFSFRFFKKGSCQLLAKVCARSTG